MDEIIEKLVRDGQVEFEPAGVGMPRYRMNYVARNCPNVILAVRTPHQAWRPLCITCDGHWCEGCHDVHDERKWEFARSIIAALAAGRRLDQMQTGFVCSTHPGVYAGHRQVSGALPPRPEEVAAAAREGRELVTWDVDARCVPRDWALVVVTTNGSARFEMHHTTNGSVYRLTPGERWLGGDGLEYRVSESGFMIERT